jgi:hypothetical protein
MPARSLCIPFAVLLTFVLGGTFPLAQETAQEKKASPKAEKKEPIDPLKADEKFQLAWWDRDDARQVRAFAVFIGQGNPATVGPAYVWSVPAARWLISEDTPALPGWELALRELLPLNPKYLDGIKDDRPLPDMRPNAPHDPKSSDRAFYHAYLQALWRSQRATPEMFENSAEETKHIVWANLKSEASRYRGKIITVKGKLKVVRKRDAPEASQEKGIPDVYSGWIAPDVKGVPPFTIAFTDLPAILFPSEKLDADVTFSGYFLGRVKFPSETKRGNKEDLISPYLVGKSPIVHEVKPPVKPPENAEEPTSYSLPLIVATMMGFAVVVLLGGLLLLWYRRGDREIQSKLAGVRDKHSPFTLEPDSAPAVEEEEKPVGDTTPADGTTPPPQE